MVFSPRLAENDLANLAESGNNFGQVTDIAPDYYYDSREFQWSSSRNNRVNYSYHQLPPILQVTMVAVDETDAARYAARFQTSGDVKPPEYSAKDLFKTYSQYDNDIRKLTTALNDIQMRHRVFTTNIRLRTGKWRSPIQ
jgi:uncharacterized protein (TIGR02599 family)